MPEERPLATTLSEKLRARAKELSHESRVPGGDWTATLLEQAAESLDGRAECCDCGSEASPPLTICDNCYQVLRNP